MRYEIVEKVRGKRPLIHCITNYVTANDVANMILAAGASPIMAESAREAEEIAQISQALVLNMGMLTDQKLEAMILAGKRAALMGHPVILDPVGAGASSFRREALGRILGEVPCTVIRGNRSEILCTARLLGEKTEEACLQKGVDTAPGSEGDLQPAQGLSRYDGLLTDLSRRTGAVIVMTGETDLAADGERIYRICNGHSMMSGITGAGCMLDGVIGAYTAVWDREGRYPVSQGVALAAAAHGLCGQLAYEKVKARKEGTGSFRTYLLDYMSLLDSNQLMGGARIEIQTIISDSIWSD